MLRFITYLSPGIPRELFAHLTEEISRRLQVHTTLLVETRLSGPARGQPDPFSTGEADVGFMCSPSLVWLRDLRPAPVELLPVPVFDDPRAGGLPIYFSDVIVAATSAAQSFEDLKGGSFAYNDPSSLSGYYCVLQHLAAGRRDAGFFASLDQSGSHLESMRRVARGRSTAAAIDSNVLAFERRRAPELAAQVRVLESWGPYPIQPVVVRATLDPKMKQQIADTLIALGGDPVLAGLGVRGFSAVTDAHYELERLALRACEGLVRKTL